MSSNTKSRLAADSHTPWIGVHSLTEFIFCPRAGLLAYESGQEPQHEHPNLRYLPEWELTAIQQRLRAVAVRLGLLILTMVAALAALQWYKPAGATRLVLFAAIGLLSLVGVRQLGLLWTLWSRQRAARRATPLLPNIESSQSESVNWWSLLKAGFESVQYQDALRDERLHLAGRPWRVLRNGSLRIPVFRITGDLRLRRQHFARMAAYCHLLETCEGCESPCGVVIAAGSYEGLTVPNTPASRKAFHDGLVAARSIVNRAKRRPPSSPTNPNCCFACPHGFPRVQRKRLFVSLSGNAKRGIDGRYYNSPCGDRFCWTPPHEKAFRKRLTHERLPR